MAYKFDIDTTPPVPALPITKDKTKIDEKYLLDKLENAMVEMINVNVVVEKTQEAVLGYLDKTARLLIDELNLSLSESSYNKIFYYLYRDFVGLNETDPLINDYFI